MGKILFPSFPRELEAEFSSAYNRDAATVARIALLLAILVFLSFYFVDRILDIDNSSVTLVIRIGVVVAAVAGVAITRPIFVRYLQPIMVTLITIAGLAYVAIMFILKDGLMHGTAGAVLILMYNFVFFGCGLFHLLSQA